MRKISLNINHCIVLLFVISRSIAAEEKDYLFYKPLPYGSQAMYNPVSMFVNGGLDVLQNYVPSSRLEDIPWNIGATNVWRSITDPFPIIKQYGWSNFLRHEVLPTSLDYRKAQFVPNYLVHAIGGGMQYRKIWEWYDYNRFPVPYLWAGITTMGYHFVNEIVENGPSVSPNEDCIPDLLIFDPLGIILFSFDPIAKYFASTFSLNEWSGQIAIAPSPLTFYNFGHSFIIKYPIFSSWNTSGFGFLGKTSLVGISQKVNSADALTIGFGGTQIDVVTVNVTNGIETKTAKVGFAMGFFYDRDNSLLTSLIISNYLMQRMCLNVYPGLVKYANFSPGLFFLMDGVGHLNAGITFRFFPIGLAI